MNVKDLVLRPAFFICTAIFVFMLFLPQILPVYQLMLIESGLNRANIAGSRRACPQTRAEPISGGRVNSADGLARDGPRVDAESREHIAPSNSRQAFRD